MNEKDYIYSAIYEIANIIFSINLKTYEDLLHFNYYYGGHESTSIKTDINLFFSSDREEGFIWSLMNKQGKKEIFYKKNNDILHLYEEFDKKTIKPSIFPPLVFFNEKLGLHGSSIVFSNEVYTFMGRSLSGKTSIILNLCQNEAFSFLSDDVTIIDLSKLSVYPFYRPLGLRFNTIKRVQYLQDIDIKDCILLEKFGKRKVVVSPLKLPLNIERSDKKLCTIFFMEYSEQVVHAQSFSININEAFEEIIHNMHFNEISLSEFKTYFSTIKFFKVIHNFNYFSSTTSLIEKIIRNND